MLLILVLLFQSISCIYGTNLRQSVINMMQSGLDGNIQQLMQPYSSTVLAVAYTQQATCDTIFREPMSPALIPGPCPMNFVSVKIDNYCNPCPHIGPGMICSHRIRTCVSAFAACTPGSKPVTSNEKMYLIQASNGQYLGVDGYDDKTRVVGFDIANDDSRLFWRVVMNGNYYRLYSVRNGGQLITHRDESTADELLVTTRNSADGEIQDWSMDVCDDSGATLLSYHGLKDGYLRRHRVGTQWSLTAQSWGESMTTSCCSSCPAGWTMTAENTMACLFCDQEECWRSAGPNAYQTERVRVSITEVVKYKVPDVVNSPVQSKTDPMKRYINLGLTVATTAAALVKAEVLGTTSMLVGEAAQINKLGVGLEIVSKYGKIASVAAKGLGILGIGISMYMAFTEPSVEEKLSQLETRIMGQVNTLVSDAVSGLAVTTAINLMTTARRSMMVRYRNQKKIYFSLSPGSYRDTQIDDLSDLASIIASDYERAVSGITPRVTNGNFDSSPTNVKIAQQGFPIYVLSMIEMFAAMQESVLIDAYSNAETSCENLLEASGMRALGAFHKNVLLKMQSFLVLNRGNQVVSNRKHPTYNYGVTARDNLWGLVLYDTSSSDNSVFTTSQAIVNKYKEGLEFFMKHYGYSITDVESALDSIISSSLTDCEKLRSDLFFRYAYEQCAIQSAPGCQMK